MPARTLIALVVCGLTVPIGAQEFSERVDVRVVEVPVNVVDDSGKAIAGLTKEDFELRVNGESQQIQYFDVLDLSVQSTPAETSGEQRAPARIERRILFLVDTVFSSHRGILRGVEAASDYLKVAHPDDLIAIAKYRSGRVEYLTPFTRDRALAYRAIRTLSSASISDPLRITISPQVRSAIAPIISPNVSGVGEIEESDSVGGTASSDWLGFGPISADDIGSFGPVGTAMSAGTGRIMDEMSEDQGRRHIREQLETLQGVARDLSTLSGQKQVLLISQGFPSSSVLKDNRLSRILHETQKEYRQHGLIIHTINTSTLEPATARLTTNRGQALFNMAYETGGIAFANKNRLDRHFDRFDRSQQVTYLLGFLPPNGVKPGYNDLDVKVTDARATRVISRPGFYGVTDQVEPSDTAIHLQLAEAVFQENWKSDIRVSVEARPTTSETTVRVSLPTVDLISARNPEAITATSMVYVLSGGTVHKMNSKELAINLSVLRNSIEANLQSFEHARLGTTETFELEPGSYVIKAIFRIKPDNLIGVASTEVIVPATPE